ncbi:MAG TPA: metal-dependent phosphohydrolase [Micromonosporaceae bacterium]|nr:metal-dependent phosphohydrolase [Micromonosporaceae bacterium]
MPAIWRRDLPPETDTVAADHVFADLVARWRQPHRHYHDLSHLAAMLAVIDRHAGWADEPAVVRLAAWFHDAVYVPRRNDNEEASAALAGSVLRRLGLPYQQIDEVIRLVRLTERHHPGPGDRNGELLCDADLSVLADEPDSYRHYTHRIRMEYSHVPDAAFRAGRIGVLRQLLAMPTLYHVPELKEAWEERARTNLNRELAALAGNSTRGQQNGDDGSA